MEFKAIAFDCDGTLTDIKSGEFIASSKEAIKELRNNGYIVILATGRPFHSTTHVREAGFEFDYYVVSNGHLIADKNGRTIHQEFFEKELFDGINDFCEEQNLGLFWKFEDGSYIYNDHPQMKEIFKNLKHFYYGKYYDSSVLPNSGALVGVEKDRQVFMEKFGGKVECVDGGVLLYDVNKLGVSKKNGLDYLMKLLNIEAKELLAFGDSENDVEMLEYAGYSVALGDGMQSCKEAADYITEATTDDGVLKALKYLKLL